MKLLSLNKKSYIRLRKAKINEFFNHFTFCSQFISVKFIFLNKSSTRININALI